MEASGSIGSLALQFVKQRGARVPIAATFSLAQAATAHRRLAKGHTLGRVMLQVR